MDKEIVQIICACIFGCVGILSVVGLIGFAMVVSDMRKDKK